MKKLVLVLAVAFGASMVACNNASSEANAEGQDTVAAVEEAVEVVETPDTVAPADSAAADTTAAAAAEEAK